ncbi:MAG: preprotein translocase subunit YajC, partial [bacterium]
MEINFMDIVGMTFLADQSVQPGPGSSSLLMMMFFFLAFWFLLIAPQRKKQKEQEKMIAALKEGDEVMTTAGIFGTI